MQFVESWIYALYLRGRFQSSSIWNVCSGATQMRRGTEHVLNFKHTRSPLGSWICADSVVRRMKNDDAMQAPDEWQCLFPAFSYLHLLCILQKESLKTLGSWHVLCLAEQWKGWIPPILKTSKTLSNHLLFAMTQMLFAGGDLIPSYDFLLFFFSFVIDSIFLDSLFFSKPPNHNDLLWFISTLILGCVLLILILALTWTMTVYFVKDKVPETAQSFKK